VRRAPARPAACIAESIAESIAENKSGPIVFCIAGIFCIFCIAALRHRGVALWRVDREKRVQKIIAYY
jgi:hypothetical protein